MSCPTTYHEWRIAPNEDVRIYCDPGSFRIGAHRNLRGPFTAAGSLIRAIAGDAIRIVPDLVATHLVTLLSVAPELGKLVDAPVDVRQAVSVSREGDPPAWGRRISNGIADFIIGYFDAKGSPGHITIFHADEADPADLDVIAVLLRRADPRTLRLTICTSTDCLPAPLAALEGSSVRRTNPATETSPGSLPSGSFLDDCLAALSPAEQTALAQELIDSDGTPVRQLANNAYRGLPAADRKAMHLARAARLRGLDEPSLLMGAIPYHHEQAAEGVETLLTASRLCLALACYDAALDWSLRGRRMLAAAPRGKIYGDLTRSMLFALLLLGRHDDVVRLCDELLDTDEDSAAQAHASYAMAILNARLYERSHHDYGAAKNWTEKAQAFMKRVPASPRRIVNDAFLMNTLALVDMRMDDLAAAEQKLNDALTLLAREAPELYPIESVILLHNMARLHLAAGRTDLAIDDLTHLLSQLPSDGDAWFDRGVIHQRAGRHAASLADYDMAVRWEPAHIQAHFHRAKVLVDLDRIDDALAAFARVIVLQPDAVDALLNRAALLRERGEPALALADVDEALRQRPADARALCLRGLLKMRAGQSEEAFEAFTQSIAADPSLADPWANRATIAAGRGDLDAALADLTQALALREDVVILCNRAKVFEKQRQWQDADEDYARALTLDGGGREAVLRGRERCKDGLREDRSPDSSSIRQASVSAGRRSTSSACG
jgi:tetratricopeptide (TPR) repeat protein